MFGDFSEFFTGFFCIFNSVRSCLEDINGIKKNPI